MKMRIIKKYSLCGGVSGMEETEDNKGKPAASSWVS